MKTRSQCKLITKSSEEWEEIKLVPKSPPMKNKNSSKKSKSKLERKKSQNKQSTKPKSNIPSFELVDSDIHVVPDFDSQAETLKHTQSTRKKKDR